MLLCFNRIYKLSHYQDLAVKKNDRRTKKSSDPKVVVLGPYDCIHFRAHCRAVSSEALKLQPLVTCQCPYKRSIVLSAVYKQHMQSARIQPVWRNRLVNNIVDCAPVFVEEVEKKISSSSFTNDNAVWLPAIKVRRKQNKQTNNKKPTQNQKTATVQSVISSSFPR